MHIDLADKGSKAFYKICKNMINWDGKTGLYPDLDYYIGVKELLKTLNI